MPAPTISDPPELPTFPSGPGLPDQPGVFIPKFLLFLAWLATFRAYLVDLITFIETNSGGGTSSSRWNVLTESSNARSLSTLDIGAHVRFTASSAVTLIIPTTHGFSVGDAVRFTQAGSGEVAVVRGSSGVVLTSLNGALSSAGRGAEWEMVCVGTNEFDVFGDLASTRILLAGDMQITGNDIVLLADGTGGELTSGV